jgi:hypothetical protein
MQTLRFQGSAMLIQVEHKSKRVYIQKWPKLQSLNVCQHLCMVKVYTCQVQVCNAGTKTGKLQEVQGTH